MMQRTWRIPYAVAVLCGVAYIFLIGMQPYPYSWLLKMLPMLIYALLVFIVLPGRAALMLSLGFVAASAGDFFLDFGQRDGLFMQALLAFLANQVLFIIGFWWLSRGGRWQWRRSLPVLLYSAVLALWMVPAAKGLELAVGLYLASLLLMALCAGRIEARPGPLWLGAMLFVLADSLIGLNKFVLPFAHSTLIIVCIYFSAQSLIAWALLQRFSQPQA